MKKMYCGEYEFESGTTCMVIETWENNNEEWKLIDRDPLEKDFKDSTFENYNITPSDDCYAFYEITKAEAEELKEEYEIYNNLLGYVGEEIDFDDINCCFDTREENVYIEENIGEANSFSSYTKVYNAYYDYKGSTVYKIFVDDKDIILDIKF